MGLEKFRDSADPLWEQRVNSFEESAGRRILFQTPPGSLAEGGGATNYAFLSTGGSLLAASSGLKFIYTNASANPIGVFIKPSDYEFTGRTPKLAVELTCIANATAPGATFTAGLYKLEKTEGANAKAEPTYEAVVTGSKAAVVAPAAEKATRVLSSLFAVPVEGFYTILVVTSVESTKAASTTVCVGALALTYT